MKPYQGAGEVKAAVSEQRHKVKKKITALVSQQDSLIHSKQIPSLHSTISLTKQRFICIVKTVNHAIQHENIAETQ